jgi:uncharacterized protein YhaN
MAVRINRIKVNRGGPLTSDFELEPGDLNVIYGHNETGKTYIVETLINLLFKTGARSPAKWNLRDWNLDGRITVSGLEPEPVRFTKTGKKLEDYWEEQAGLPEDFSRLLVVKAGDTILVEEDEDGLGRGILKDYLSGEGLLDEIGARISATLQSATLQDRQINGAQRGEIRTRIECVDNLSRVNTLLSAVEEGYTSGDIHSLQQKQELIDAELNKLEKAKRHHAARLDKKLKNLCEQKETLPTEQELSTLESDIRLHDSKTAECETKSDTWKTLHSTSDGYKWTEKALGVYSEIMGGRAVSDPNPMFLILGVLFFAAGVTSGLFELKIPMVLCAVISIVLFILHSNRIRKALSRIGDSRELKNLKTEFNKRFRLELTDKATLQSKLDDLRTNHIRATTVKEELDKLEIEIHSRESSIKKAMKDFVGTDVSPGDWRDNIRTLRTGIKKLDNDIRSLENSLVSLNVPKEDHLDRDPGTEWDAQRSDTLKEKLAETKKVLDQEVNDLDMLKTRIIQETNSQSTEWEDLITVLRDQGEEAAERYREITSEILAKMQVNAAINEFREEENTRIAGGLKRQELIEPLQAITQRYNGIRQEEDSGRVFVTEGDEEYPLAALSTGAREQVFVALRTGFASIAMEGQRAFLILDDAFQHSDWNRRENLITETLSFVKAGWQVFYFSVDDHIRDLFQKAGSPLGAQFKSVELF